MKVLSVKESRKFREEGGHQLRKPQPSRAEEGLGKNQDQEQMVCRGLDRSNGPPDRKVKPDAPDQLD